MSWLPDDFEHPTRVDLPTGHHIRPIRGTDTDIDYPAVMGSQARLFSMYGTAWGWPPPTMTVAADREDLERHEREIEAHESFNYCILDEAESELLGCIYIDPPASESPADVDAEVSWWVVDAAVGSALETAVDAFVPRWLAEAWPFEHPKLGLPGS